MNGRLTTHVLDTAHGRPAANVRVELFRMEDGEWRLVKEIITNEDGRTEQPLLEEPLLNEGMYELLFHMGEYFENREHPDARKFLDRVPVIFNVSNPDEPYHVPLLASPWSYSTYRGS